MYEYDLLNIQRCPQIRRSSPQYLSTNHPTHSHLSCKHTHHPAHPNDNTQKSPKPWIRRPPPSRVSAPVARAPPLSTHPLIPVRRHEHRRVDRRRVLVLRDRGRRKRRGARGLALARRVVAHEHEREPGRGHAHAAHVVRLVARHVLEVQVALEPPVRLELPAERLVAPRYVELVPDLGRDEVPAGSRKPSFLYVCLCTEDTILT